jgi:membrane associated rhomboid family serine protease
VSTDHTPEAETTTCYRHPSRETRLACSECGRPICGSCAIDAAVGQRCPRCVGDSGRQQTIDARTVIGRRRSLPPVTLAIVVITVGAYLLGGGSVGSALFDLLAQSKELVAAGEWWRIFGAALLHSGLAHIFFNMYALYVLGPQVERSVGAGSFLALYLAAAGMGGVFAQLFTPGQFVAVGASGAIFGLFGYWLDLAFRQRRTSYGRALLGQFGFLLLINAALPLILPGISWQAHLGGLITGVLIGETWARLRGGRAEQARIAVGAVVVIASIALAIVAV